MFLRTFFLISLLATVAPAAVKRDEFGGSSNSEHSGSASSSSQSYQPLGSGSSQGNLYYYYYPPQDKGKEHSYQASSSNQYTSAVTPGNGASASGVVSGDVGVVGGGNSGSVHTPMESGASNGQDLSYSAQDLSYSAQSIGQSLGQGIGDYTNQGASNYEQLSNIASQLQQYGVGTGSSGSLFNPTASGYAGSPSSYNSGNSYTLTSDGTSGGYSASGPGSSPIYGGASSGGSGGSSFPTSGDGSNPYSASVPMSSFGPGAGGYAGQAGPIPYNAQPGYHYQSNSYDSHPAASNQHASYEPPSSGYRRYGIGSAILPILALAGLSLLIPTVTSLSTATGRKRRSTNPAKESALSTYFDRLERYWSLYKTAVEREECMNRIICELGDAMSNVSGKSTLFSVMERIAPAWMGNKVGVLKNGALSPEYGKCKKYTCQ